MKVFGSLLGAAARALGGSQEHGEDPRALRAECERHKKRADDYFALVRRMEEQRDVWRELYYDQMTKHAAAQQLLEAWLAGARLALGRVLGALNEIRKAEGKPALTAKACLPADAPPIGQARTFLEWATKAAAEMPKALDGEVERQALRAAHDAAD